LIFATVYIIVLTSHVTTLAIKYNFDYYSTYYIITNFKITKQITL